MNLLKDDFISTTCGKVSLKTILTTNRNYQLQYYFDEVQLAMLQLLSSLSTFVLQPSLKELKNHLKNGLTAEQYDRALEKIELQWFESDCFMQSRPNAAAKWFDAPITKLVSGIECGSSANANGLFSEKNMVEVICPDCMHILNYNLHMNIKAEIFSSTGATGIRGGGVITTLVAGNNLKNTILNNTIAIDYFNECAQLDPNVDNTPMWINPISGETYQAFDIGLLRGLFALAYHIDFLIKEESCICDVCGHKSNQSIRTFNRIKYNGFYGSTKKGREQGAALWLHPYTPHVLTKKGLFSISAKDQTWQSWQELTAYVVAKETENKTTEPAYIFSQFKKMKNQYQTNLLVGGNITNKGSIIGRVYDLYSMPASLDRHLNRVTQVIDIGLEKKDVLSQGFSAIFKIGYDEKFVGAIKEAAMLSFTANAQQIIQNTLLDVERKDVKKLQILAAQELKKEVISIFSDVQRRYQYDLPLFKALVKGELIIRKKNI